MMLQYDGEKGPGYNDDSKFEYFISYFWYVIEGVVNMKPDLYLEMLCAGGTQSKMFMNHFVVYTINNCSYKETTKGLSKYK